MKEFIEQNPDLKKQRKEIQTQRYELYNQERLANIERCKSKRNEIISHSKKVVPKPKEEELDNNENYDDYNMNKYRIRNSDDNYVIRKVYSGKKRENELFETIYNAGFNGQQSRDQKGRSRFISMFSRGKKEIISKITKKR